MRSPYVIVGLQLRLQDVMCDIMIVYSISELEMWANAQSDGRPAEYRWRPLFNAAKFG